VVDIHLQAEMYGRGEDTLSGIG